MIFSAADLDFCLRRWRRGYGEPPPPGDEEEIEDAIAAAYSTADYQSVLEQALEFGLKTKRTKEAVFHRDRSRARLAICGRQLDDGKTEPAPAWGVDPVRSVRQSNAGGSPRAFDPIAEIVERAALSLYSFDRVLGVCLRVEYCTRGKFREKVARAGRHLELGNRFPSKEYRRGVDRARIWMAGLLTAEAMR